jgi:hypothetical protein
MLNLRVAVFQRGQAVPRSDRSRPGEHDAEAERQQPAPLCAPGSFIASAGRQGQRPGITAPARFRACSDRSVL